MAKRKKKTSKKNSKTLVYIAWFLAVVALVMSLLVAGYYFGYSDANKQKTEHKKLEQKIKQKKIQREHLKDVNKRLKEVLKKESKKELTKVKHQDITAAHEYADEHLSKPPKGASRKVVRGVRRPKLAIIIDDVSTKYQVRDIKSIGINLTMSFFPPRSARPNSAKLAAKEKFYMVHLPMEAFNFHAEEPLTLRVTDSQAKITNRIKTIKKLFPRVRYINNHTGSKFTANEIAVNRLILALSSQHINFIDSRTTAKTKVPKVMKNYGLKYVARDVFLDHDMDKASVIHEIKRAIKIAKLHGTAIAIGHPHPNTIAALKESKYLFKDVDLVQVNQIY